MSAVALLRELRLSAAEFALFQRLIERIAGVHLSEGKQIMLNGRLARRVRQLGLESFRQYYDYLVSGRDPAELQTMVDLLTTHETYFFREPQHFEFLARELIPRRRAGPFRAWSAACSSGEEPYSLAMVLCEHLGSEGWEVFASDIAEHTLAKARTGHYVMERIDGIPAPYLKKYFLKGVRSQEGTLLVDDAIRKRVRFHRINLTDPLPGIGTFDLILLRNVMIYFTLETKRHVVGQLLSRLKPGGHLIVGHAESLQGVCDDLVMVRPTVYRRR